MNILLYENRLNIHAYSRLALEEKHVQRLVASINDHLASQRAKGSQTGEAELHLIIHLCK